MASASQAANVAKNVDQVELAAMKRGVVHLETGLRDEMIAGSLQDDFPASAANEWAASDITLDDAASADASEIERRLFLMGDAYPFKLEANALRYAPGTNKVYEFCLATCLAPTITNGDYVKLPRAFERLTGALAAAFLGPGAQWYRAGWPPDGDRPASYRDVMGDLNERTSEWHWHEYPGLPPDPKHVKDGGVDVVAWKRIDKRVGSLFLLGQCACGEDWPLKFRDLDPDVVREKYLKSLSLAKQIRFFATPHHIAHQEKWIEGTTAGGILFDRTRLTLLASSYPAGLHGNKDDLTSLINIAVTPPPNRS